MANEIWNLPDDPDAEYQELEEPKGSPPDDKQPWMWIDGKWQLMMSDAADGVPAKLDFSKKGGQGGGHS